LDWIVMKALEKDRARRYETANGLATDVQRYLTGEPVQAVPPSVGYRLRKLARRYKGPVTAAAVVLMVLTAGTAVSSWQAVRAQAARTEEAAQRRAAQESQAAAEATTRDMEVALADLYTSHGIMAGDRDEPDLAALRFAHAARLAGHEPGRQEANRLRVRTWGRQAVVPVRTLEHPGQVLTRMAFHPGGDHLLTLSRRDRCVVWDLAAERPLPWAAGDRAVRAVASSPDGRSLAWGTRTGGSRCAGSRTAS
jgi:hypothetical protein